MIRYPSFFVVFLIIFVAISLYLIKHFISKKEIELAIINNQIINVQSDIYILSAELSYLKRPDRLQSIAINKLKMRGILQTDIWNLKDLIDTTKSLNDEGKSS